MHYEKFEDSKEVIRSCQSKDNTIQWPKVKETKKWYTKNKDWEKVVWFMVFSVTFNHISVISRLSVSLVEDTWENHLPVGSRWQTWSHNVVSTTPRHGRDSNSQL